MVSVIHSILLKGLYGVIIASVQGRRDLRVTSAYHTAAEAVALAIASIPTIDLLGTERKRVYEYEIRRGGARYHLN